MHASLPASLHVSHPVKSSSLFLPQRAHAVRIYTTTSIVLRVAKASERRGNFAVSFDDSESISRRSGAIISLTVHLKPLFQWREKLESIHDDLPIGFPINIISQREASPRPDIPDFFGQFFIHRHPTLLHINHTVRQPLSECKLLYSAHKSFRTRKIEFPSKLLHETGKMGKRPREICKHEIQEKGFVYNHALHCQCMPA